VNCSPSKSFPLVLLFRKHVLHPISARQTVSILFRCFVFQNEIFPNVVFWKGSLRTRLSVRSTDPGIILVKLSFDKISIFTSTEACEYVDWIVANCAFPSRQSGTWCERSARLSPSFALGSFPNQKMQMTVMFRALWYKGYKGYKGSPPKPPKPYVLSLAPMAPMPSGPWKSALVLSHREILHWSHLVSSWNSWCKEILSPQVIQASNQDRTQFQWLHPPSTNLCKIYTRFSPYTIHSATFMDLAIFRNPGVLESMRRFRAPNTNHPLNPHLCGTPKLHFLAQRWSSHGDTICLSL